jgi:hypothetical protein
MKNCESRRTTEERKAIFTEEGNNVEHALGKVRYLIGGVDGGESSD